MHRICNLKIICCNNNYLDMNYNDAGVYFYNGENNTDFEAYTPKVEESQEETDIISICSTGLSILGITSFIVSFLAGAGVGGGLMYFLRSKSQKKIENPNTVYDYIDREIALADNMSYSRTKPKLPKPRATLNETPQNKQ